MSNIYPDKPIAPTTPPAVKPDDAFTVARDYALGKLTFENACAALKVQGPQFQGYLNKYKLLVDQVKAEMVKNKNAADVAALKTAVNVTDPHGFKPKIIDDLLDRETLEGDLAAFKAKYS